MVGPIEMVFFQSFIASAIGVACAWIDCKRSRYRPVARSITAAAVLTVALVSFLLITISPAKDLSVPVVIIGNFMVYLWTVGVVLIGYLIGPRAVNPRAADESKPADGDIPPTRMAETGNPYQPPSER